MQQHSRHGLNHNLISSRLAWIKAVVIYMAQVQHVGNMTDICYYSEIFLSFLLPFLGEWPCPVAWQKSLRLIDPPPPSCISASSKKKEIQTTVTKQMSGNPAESSKKLKWDFIPCFLLSHRCLCTHMNKKYRSDWQRVRGIQWKYGMGWGGGCRAEEEKEVIKMRRSWAGWGQN